MAKKKKTAKPKNEAAGQRFRDRIVRVERIRAGDLLPNPKNFQTHSKKQVDAVTAVLDRLGFIDAVKVRETADGLQLIDGHLRRDIAADEVIPVIVLDLDDAEADFALATFDPSGRLANIDHEKLEALRAEIENEIEAIEVMLDAAIREGKAYVAKAITEDATPAPPEVADTEPGDVYTLGRHRLVCGDSSDAATFKTLLRGSLVQCCNTDPPYNVGVKSRSDSKNRAKDYAIANDEMDAGEFAELLAAWFGNIAASVEPGRACYFWGGWSNVSAFPKAMEDAGIFWHQQIVWVKNSPVLSRKDFMLGHEWAFYGWRKGAGHKFFGPNNATDVWTFDKVPQSKMVHLTEKPVALAARAIEYSTKEGEAVLDPFGGSGSTLMACEQLNRNAYLAELM